MASRNNRNQYQGLFVQDITCSTAFSLTVSSASVGNGTVTVNGVAVGDEVKAVFQTALPAGVLVHANVTAANTVDVVVANYSGSTLTLTSASLFIRASRPNSGLYTAAP